MARYSKQTWDTTSIFNPTRMNHIEQGIYDADLREGGTIGGGLNINVPSGSTARGTSQITLGNNIPTGTVGNSRGTVALYSDNQYVSVLTPYTLTADRVVYLPDKGGTIALTSDDDWTSIAQGVTSVDISNTSYKEYLVVALLSSVSPNLCYTLHLYRGVNILTGKLKYVMGSWANGSYGTAVEITGQTNGNIEVVSAYVNGSNVLTNAKLYVSGRH